MMGWGCWVGVGGLRDRSDMMILDGSLPRVLTARSRTAISSMHLRPSGFQVGHAACHPRASSEATRKLAAFPLSPIAPPTPKARPQSKASWVYGSAGSKLDFYLRLLRITPPLHKTTTTTTTKQNIP